MPVYMPVEYVSMSSLLLGVDDVKSRTLKLIWVVPQSINDHVYSDHGYASCVSIDKANMRDVSFILGNDFFHPYVLETVDRPCVVDKTITLTDICITITHGI